MQSEFPQPLLVEFNRSSAFPVDWQESSSNLCLYFLRAALGTDCGCTLTPTANVTLIQKTYSSALRALAGLIAFTLWLPFTIVGIILNHFSQSHANACKAAHTALQSHKEPAQPTPEPPRPTTQVTSVFKEVATVVAPAKQDPPQIRESRALITRMKQEKIDLWEQWGKQWNSWRAKVIVEEEKQRSLLLEKSRANPNTYDLRKEGQKISQWAIEKLQWMLRDALKIIGEDPEMLTSLYLGAYCVEVVELLSVSQLASITRELNKTAGYEVDDSDNVSESLTILIESIATATFGYSATEMLERVTIVPRTLGQNPLNWVTKLPLALRQKWAKTYEHQSIVAYCSLHTVQQVLANRVPQNRTLQMRSLAHALTTWLDFTEASNFNMPKALAELLVAADVEQFALFLDSLAFGVEEMNKSHAPTRVQLKVAKFLKKLSGKHLGTLRAEHNVHPLHVPAEKLARFQHILNACLYLHSRTENLLNKVGFRLHLQGVNVMAEMLRMPLGVEKTRELFIRFLDHCKSCHTIVQHKKQFSCMCWTLPIVKTDTALKAVIDGVLRANFPTDYLAKSMQDSAGAELPSVVRFSAGISPEQVQTRLQEGIKEITAAVKDALASSGLLGPLQDLILDYCIAIKGLRT